MKRARSTVREKAIGSVPPVRTLALRPARLICRIRSARVASDRDFDICLQMAGESLQSVLNPLGGIGLQLDAIDQGGCAVAPGFAASVEVGYNLNIPIQASAQECRAPPMGGGRSEPGGGARPSRIPRAAEPEPRTGLGPRNSGR